MHLNSFWLSGFHDSVIVIVIVIKTFVVDFCKKTRCHLYSIKKLYAVDSLLFTCVNIDVFVTLFP